MELWDKLKCMQYKTLFVAIKQERVSTIILYVMKKIIILHSDLRPVMSIPSCCCYIIHKEYNQTLITDITILMARIQSSPHWSLQPQVSQKWAIYALYFESDIYVFVNLCSVLPFPQLDTNKFWFVLLCFLSLLDVLHNFLSFWLLRLLKKSRREFKDFIYS